MKELNLNNHGYKPMERKRLVKVNPKVGSTLKLTNY